MSRSWLLYLDDLIASAQKIERLTGPNRRRICGRRGSIRCRPVQPAGHRRSVKKLPDEARAGLSETHRSGPARLRDLIAHRYFALADIVWDVARRQVPSLGAEAIALRTRFDNGGRSDPA